MQIKNKLRGIFDLQLFIKLIELISYLNKSTKRKLKLILFVMLLNSFAELITIGSLLPLIDIAFNPTKISNISYLNIFFNTLNIQQNYQFIAISFLFLIVIVFSTFFKIFAVKLINDYIETLNKELGVKLYRAVLNKDYSYYLNTNSSLLISSIVQQLDVSISIVSTFLNMILALFCILGILVSLTIINFKIIFGTTLIFLVFYYCANTFTKKFANKLGKLVYEQRVKLIRLVKESIGFIRQIILDDSQEILVKEYNKTNSIYARSTSILSTVQQVPRYLIELILLSLVVIFLILLVINNVNLNSYLPQFGVFLLAIQKLLPLFQKIFTGYFQICQDKYSLYSVVSLLKDSQKLEFYLRKKPFKIFDFRYKIRFENISFSYKENIVLQNINHEIRKGEVIGVVGKTGAGKSTFIDLMMGLLKPTKGNIFVDDKKMNPALFKKFRLSVSNVPQDYFLLDRSIEENIVFGKIQKNIDYKLLKNVVKISMLDDFIRSLKYGLKTNVGEDGVKLSGGQKQRIAIARAIYKDHSFLLLDEATSSVDLNTERKIINNLISNYPDVTVLMIAHRLESLKNCNYILEIKDKKLIKHNSIKDYKFNLNFN